MRLPPAITVTALAGLLATIAALIALVRAGRASRRQQQRDCGPYLLLVLGIGLTALGLAVPVVAILVAPDVIAVRATRLDVGVGVAIACAAGSVALVGGLLCLPGVAGSRQARLRRALDGLLIAAGLCFLGWVLVVVPRPDLYGLAIEVCVVTAVSACFALAATGISAQAGLRARQSRGTAILASTGVALVAGGCAGVAGGFCYGQGTVLACAGITAATGMALVAVGAPRLDGATAPHRAATPDQASTSDGSTTQELAATPDADGLEPAGQVVPVIVVIAICLTSLYSLASQGSLDRVSVIAGIIAGLGLLARQSLAVRDSQRAAARLLEREIHFRRLAHTDALTGLENRRGLLRVLREQAVGGPACVLLGLDLDGFKNVNDLRGHAVGDAVLIEVGQRLRNHLRPGDLAARLGGDEFAVLMWARPPEAMHVARRLLDVLSEPYHQANGTVFLSTSIGVAGCGSADDVQSLLRNADLALRYAKQRGKARVEFYDARYDAALRRRTEIEQALRGAIDRDELHLVFQPVVSLPSVRPVGAEALLRWHHPELGQVSPVDFIPVAEEAGLISRIGLWVLHQACHQLSRWLGEGHDVWVSANVSVRELHNPGYVDQVAEVLRAHRVPPQRLVLEVTEQEVAMDLDELIDRLKALRETGVRVALDDFGAGYSSLGQLHRLPVDILKIDRGLLQFVEIVVRLGHQLGLSVITEGVEEPTQRRHIELVGGQFGQGELFGRPMPAEHIEAMLAAVAPRLVRQSLPRRRRTAAATSASASASTRPDSGTS